MKYILLATTEVMTSAAPFAKANKVTADNDSDSFNLRLNLVIPITTYSSIVVEMNLQIK